MKYIKTYEKISNDVRKDIQKLRRVIKKIGGINVNIRTTYAGAPLDDGISVSFVHRKNFDFLNDMYELSEFFSWPAIHNGDKNYWVIDFDIENENIQKLIRILGSDNPEEQLKIEETTDKYNL